MLRLLSLAALCLLTACQPAPPPAAPEAGESMVFRRGNGGDPDTLDPHRSEGTSAGNILRDLYEGLVGETVDAALRPGAAKSWTVSDDGLVYTFLLHEDGRWSNGDPVVAEDFVFGLRRSVSPGTASSYAQLLAPIRNAKQVIAGALPASELGVEALDPHTLRITLETPTPYLLGMLTHNTTFPLHRPSLEAHGEGFTRPGRLVSNGPYRLEEYLPQSHVKLVRNARYRASDQVAIDTVYYYNTEDRNAELKRYLADELDYTFVIPTTQISWIRERLARELKSAPYLSVYYYVLNLSKPPFKDNPALRQALSMAIDRRVLVEKITAAGEVPAYGLVPPGVAGHLPARFSWADLDDESRLARARTLYREAGFSEQTPLRVELRYNTSENHRKIAVAVAAMWKQALGVETTLLNQEWKVFLQTRKDRNAWEVIRFSWVGDYNDANTFLEIMRSDHGQNDAAYASAEFDALLESAAVETDARVRQDMLMEAEQVLLRDNPVIPLYFPVSKHLVKPRVKGYRPNIMNRDQSRYFSIVND